MMFRLIPRSGALLLVGLVAACGSAPPATFDLSGSREIGKARSFSRQIAVAEPRAIAIVDSDRIVVRASDGSVSYLGGAQWADRLPRLVQTRIIQAFETVARVGSVSRPGERTVPDVVLATEFRAFEINARTGEAVVEMTARLIDDRRGRVIAAQVFARRAPVGAIDGPDAARALDTALSAVMVDLVRWTAGRL